MGFSCLRVCISWAFKGLCVLFGWTLCNLGLRHLF
uniref:Uncharacterized protein n=1 Tax=Manihot esculenta TaxID=3983 RepID=A0A2C9WMD9_MANES